MKQDVCDRCGKVISPFKRPHNVFDQRIWYSKVVWRKEENPYKDWAFDLCDKCSQALHKWIENGEKGND